MAITSGRITERHIAPKKIEPRRVEKREGWGRKTLDVAIGECVTIGPDVIVVVTARERDGHMQLVIDAPLSVVIGSVQEAAFA